MSKDLVDKAEFEKEENAIEEIHSLLGFLEESDLQDIRMLLTGMVLVSSKKH